MINYIGLTVSLVLKFRIEERTRINQHNSRREINGQEIECDRLPKDDCDKQGRCLIKP